MSIDHSIEQYGYRHIPGFPGYCVGDDGSVWSRWRNNGKMGKWKELSPYINQQGRLSACLSRKNHKPKLLCVHQLVMMSFVGPCPKGKEVAHWDGNPLNNRLDNLRYATRKENSKDRVRHGTDNRGSKNYSAKLTEKQVLQIRKSHSLGMSCGMLADKYGMNPKTISRICRRITWNHIK